MPHPPRDDVSPGRSRFEASTSSQGVTSTSSAAKIKLQMADSFVHLLTPRQREILRRVVEEYVSTGQPVGSKTLVERSSMGVSSSTVRNEFAVLEDRGLLTHPHTSAGRVPTETGYRYYADELLEHVEPEPRDFPLDLGETRTEIESALQATTEMLSQVNRLLA